jgi:hypothetical protein
MANKMNFGKCEDGLERVINNEYLCKLEIGANKFILILEEATVRRGNI